jgi:2-polyprenyl-3-methyl-5-hydroxy-6-metoxy-1,4-benzoquinol methylase/glycosyltransferase involved in cell wall biosynthesis
MTRYTWAFYVNSVPLTRDIRDGRAGLGGSESACLGLARALAQAGQVVHIHAQRLAADATGPDAWGVIWHDAGQDDAGVYAWCDVVDPDVFVSLRMAHVYASPVRARLRLLWNQDLLVGPQGAQAIMATSWQVDRYVYVSDYHRQQWEAGCPDLRGLAWVTRNGYDPAHVPTDVATVPGRVCYITRPERGLGPLLAMWPALKAAVPQAELHCTRYSSMYDGEGGAVAEMCRQYDRLTAEVAARVGGIVTYEGGLGKADLYRLIASSAVMWYPGVADFAETSCVAAIEAQACGTAFVGSAKGALPETVPHGTLLAGDAHTPAYQAASVAAVVAALTDPASVAPQIAAGRAHVARYTYAAIAQDWIADVTRTFEARRAADGPGVLRQLLQYDDHVAALPLAQALGEADAVARCTRVIAGQDQTADDYGDRAQHDVLAEIRSDGRLRAAWARCAGCTRVLDVACGNGAFALGLALTDPAVQVVGYDYAADNIARAQAAAESLGVADRVTFRQAVIYDYATHTAAPTFVDALAADADGFDGAFVGEFLEHIAEVAAVLDVVHAALRPGGRVVATMPSGPFTELMPPGMPIKRGHVHHFAYDDLQAVFGTQTDASIDVLQIPDVTPRGNPVAHWLVTYTPNGTPLGARPLDKRRLTTRPMPRLSVGLIVGPGARLDLPKCLETVTRVADEIVIGLCGADAETAAVAAQYDARVIALSPVADLPGGFAEARNAVLDACTGEWFLWIDADEQLVGSTALRPYLDAATFHGFVIKQTHLQLDAPPFSDEPIRLFRRRPDVRFYGAVHEQPQRGDANGDIWPSLALPDVQIAHYGYLTEGVRRRKALHRNLALLVRDRVAFPDRRLGRVLWLREFATWLREIGARQPTYQHALEVMVQAAGGLDAVSAQVFDGRPVPTSGLALAQVAADLYEAHFPDPADKLAQLARPFYETALRVLPEAWEVDFAFAGTPGGLRGRRAKAKPFWTRSMADVRRVLDAAVAPLAQALHPTPIHTDPFDAKDAAA